MLWCNRIAGRVASRDNFYEDIGNCVDVQIKVDLVELMNSIFDKGYEALINISEIYDDVVTLHMISAINGRKSYFIGIDIIIEFHPGKTDFRVLYSPYESVAWHEMKELQTLGEFNAWFEPILTDMAKVAQI